jgi:hypothetical protein
MWRKRLVSNGLRTLKHPSLAFHAPGQVFSTQAVYSGKLLASLRRAFWSMACK